MTPQKYVDLLSSVRMESVFNPYSDYCSEHDKEDAPQIRRRNLVSVLDAFLESDGDCIWFGRDLGYRGGRRTGLALTDEPHLEVLASMMGGITISQATRTLPVVERTAHVVWGMIDLVPQLPFLWNVFPFHPYEKDEPMSNRCHTSREAKLCEEILSSLLAWIKPTRIVGIGNDSNRMLTKMGYRVVYVRHPSYGGQNDFIRGIRSIYKLRAPQ